MKLLNIEQRRAMVIASIVRIYFNSHALATHAKVAIYRKVRFEADRFCNAVLIMMHKTLFSLAIVIFPQY